MNVCGVGRPARSSTATGSGPGRRQAPSQAPYYHVLIKGERLTPKPGRADDLTWPKTEPEIAIPAALPVPPARPSASKPPAPRS